MAGRAVIAGVRGREVLDAAGGAALEVTVRLESGAAGRAVVPGQDLRGAVHAVRVEVAEIGALRSVGETGGFAPNVPSVSAALELAETAIERAGHRPGEDVALAVDAGASRWRFGSGYRLAAECLTLSGPALVARWADLAAAYPIAALIDPLGDDDPDGWAALQGRVGHRVQLVGGLELVSSGLAGAVSLGLDGAGTLTALRERVAVARAGGCGVVLSRAPAETEDSTLADLAVGLGAGQIRAGGPCRGECTAKYNRLLRIEEALGDDALYAGHAPFRVRVR